MLGGLGDAPSGRVQLQTLKLAAFLSEPNHPHLEVIWLKQLY